MKRNLLILFFFLICSFSKGQITGSALVCPGYVYTYTANIVGAATYTWNLPNGWLVLSGQGTSQIQVMCNVSDGDVCADGYDGGGGFIAQNCFTTGFGGDGVGWDADKTTIGNCICSSYTIAVTYNGSSNPCGGCGSGSLSPNAVFAVYDTIWPLGNYLGLADGITQYDPLPVNLRALKVYLIDTTLGLSNAVLINGSPCAATINNTVQIFPCTPPTLNLQIDHTPVCVGDTFSILENSGLGTFPVYNWSTQNADIQFLSPLNIDSVICSYSGTPGSNPVLNLTTTDVFGCPYTGSFTVDVVNCISPPVCSFVVDKDSICPGLCVNFQNTTINGAQFTWYFPGATQDTSTSQNPATICYSSPGDYDVALVGVNGGGTDSIYLASYIHVFPFAQVPILQLINDTLYANQGQSAYTWYLNGSLISGANAYWYVPVQNGNYTVEITNMNGCTSSFELSNVVLSVWSLNSPRYMVYPQPANDFLILHSMNSGEFSLSLIDAIGQVTTFNHLHGNENQIDVSSLSSGIYTLQVLDAQNIFIQKVIIQK